MEPLHHAVTRAYRRRFPDIQGTDMGDRTVERLEVAVHRGLDYLVPFIEFSKLQTIYLTILERRETAKETGRGASSVMTVKSHERRTPPSTIADHHLQTDDLNKYRAQLDRIIEYLGPYGIQLERDKPLDEQNLPTTLTLLQPRVPPEANPLRVDLLAYQPPASPRKPRKRGEGGGRKATSSAKATSAAKEKTKPDQGSHRRDGTETPSDDGSGGTESDHSPMPAKKRRRVKL